MNFEEYEEIVRKHNFDMIQLYIYYNLKCNENMQLDYVNMKSDNIKSQLEYFIQFIYKAYLKDEQRLDLSFLCDVAVEFKNEILNNKIDVWDLLTECSERI